VRFVECVPHTPLVMWRHGRAYERNEGGPTFKLSEFLKHHVGGFQTYVRESVSV